MNEKGPERKEDAAQSDVFAHVPDFADDRELVAIAEYFFVQNTPFNRVLGMEIEWVKDDGIGVRFQMREDLVGNAYRGLLHGGVTASILDVVGGMASFFSLRSKLKGQPIEKAAEKFSRLGTVDLRIDYLRPGQGKVFTSTGKILRTGSKIAVARMDLKNEQGKLLAVGTGTYMVG